MSVSVSASSGAQGAIVTQTAINLGHAAAAGSASVAASSYAATPAPLGPSFFVLQSSTSVFAGSPGVAGKIDKVAAASLFNRPIALAFDLNSQLFIADMKNARIRRIQKTNGMCSTIASISGGDGPIENEPQGLVFDQNGTLYILQTGKLHHIYAISPAGRVNQVAGSSQHASTDITGNLFRASFHDPRAVAVDSHNRLYVVDRGSNSVRRVDLEEKTVVTLVDADNDDEPLDLLNPEGIAIDRFDDIYIADTGNHRILRLTLDVDEEEEESHEEEDTGADGDASTLPTVKEEGSSSSKPSSKRVHVQQLCGVKGVAGYGTGPGATALLSSPTGLAIDKQNHLWIADAGNRCIRMFSYRSDLLFTVSGRSDASETNKLYVAPTDIALSYDSHYGATLSPSAPADVQGNPEHPLYESYLTPTVFVADAGAHCIIRVHTIMLEPVYALFDCINNEPEDADLSMHHALAYPELHRRDGLMQVLLQLKPHLLTQRDEEQRLPMHIAALQSATPFSGSISLNMIREMLRLATNDILFAEDAQGCTPVAYAMQQMALHASHEEEKEDEDEINEEKKQDEKKDGTNKKLRRRPSSADASPAVVYSRGLLSLFLTAAPSSFSHASCRQYASLHWLIRHGFGLKSLRKYVGGVEEERDRVIMNEGGNGTGSLDATAALNAYPNPFLVRDEEGRLPLHIACMLDQDVGLDVVRWLSESAANYDASWGVPIATSDDNNPERDPVKMRDESVMYVKKLQEAAGIIDYQHPAAKQIVGHHPLFYACTHSLTPGGDGLPLIASERAVQAAFAPVYKLSASQREVIEYLLKKWPQAILECEGVALLHTNDLPTELTAANNIADARAASVANTFIEYVYYHKAMQLLELFFKYLPTCIDMLAWQDSLESPETASQSGSDAKASVNMLSMLHCSACIGDYELVGLLLRCGANPYNEDTRGHLPIEYATEPRCIKLLEKYMASDPRRPKTPEPVPVFATTETQTDEDAMLVAAQTKLADLEKTLQQREAELLAKCEAEKLAAKKAIDEALAAKNEELVRIQRQQAEQLEAEKSRLTTNQEQAIREAEQAAKRAQQQFEKELLEKHQKQFEDKQQELQRSIEAERKRLEEEQRSKLTQVEQDSVKHRSEFEAEVRRANEEALRAEQRRLEDEFELQRKKLEVKERELKAELEEERVRALREAERRSRTQSEEELEREKAKLKAEYEAAQKALREREAEQIRRLEAERESEQRRAKDALEAERRKLEQERLESLERLREESALKRRMDEERMESERQKYEQDRQRDAERIEAERKKLEQEKEAIRKQLEEQQERDRIRQERVAIEAAERHAKLREEIDARAQAALERESQRAQRETELREQLRRENEEREMAHRKALAEQEETYQARLAERERMIREEAQTLQREKASRIEQLEAEIEKARTEVEAQMREKHTNARTLAETRMELEAMEEQLKAMSKRQKFLPNSPYPYSANPLLIDPAALGRSELPGVAGTIASFAMDFDKLSFPSLLALLLSIPVSSLQKAITLMRLYLTSHPGICSALDESTGLWPLHLCARAGLRKELVDIIFRAFPQALQMEDRRGVLAVFHACAGRKQRMEEGVEKAKEGEKSRMTEENQDNAEKKHEVVVADDSESVARYQETLQLIKYLALLYPDSIYLPNVIMNDENNSIEATSLGPSSHPNTPSSHRTPLVKQKSSSSTALTSESKEVEVPMSDQFKTISVVEFALMEQDLDLLRLLFEITNGKFLEAVDSRGCTYLHRAAAAGQLPLVRWLVEEGGIDPWTLCDADRTALEYVSETAPRGLSVYLTRAMAMATPERRTKQRRGAQRLLIRDGDASKQPSKHRVHAWIHGTSAAGKKNGNNSRLKGKSAAVRPFKLDGANLDELLNAAANSANNTPRSRVTPLQRLRSRPRVGDMTSTAPPSHSFAVPPALKSSATPHVTHIHVYMPPGSGKKRPLARKSSLPSLQQGTSTSPKSNMLALRSPSPSSASSSSSSSASTSSLHTLHTPAASPATATPTRASGRTYHWRFNQTDGNHDQCHDHGHAHSLSSARSHAPLSLSPTSRSHTPHHHSSPPPPRLMPPTPSQSSPHRSTSYAWTQSPLTPPRQPQPRSARVPAPQMVKNGGGNQIHIHVNGAGTMRGLSNSFSTPALHSRGLHVDVDGDDVGVGLGGDDSTLLSSSSTPLDLVGSTLHSLQSTTATLNYLMANLTYGKARNMRSGRAASAGRR